MSTLNIRCKHDVSDEDCYKCLKRGIIYRCPANCEYYEDELKIASPEFTEYRKKLMDRLNGIEEGD